MENYHLIQQIGEGSFGRVYKARRKYTSRMVAIKMINKKGQHEEDLISFRREIDILTKVDHPNIMRLLEVLETDTDFCVVSELARGDLFQIIDDNQTLPENVLRSVSCQLVSAMNHLHQNRIIHRDIKPQNVLIASNNSLKLCDFGFARALSCTTLVLTSIKGTPLYMAPELVKEMPYDEKIDIWSLGVILYELYYGKPPYYTNSIYKLIQMITNDPITWPGTISPEFKDFLQNMLQKDPNHRASCPQLLNHPFIKNIKNKDIHDKMYRFKSDQFHEALVDPLSVNFSPPQLSSPDFQTIMMDPSKYSPEELLDTIKQIPTDNSDSPLTIAFANHFADFLTSPNVAEEASKAATKLLQLDSQKFFQPLSAGIMMLTEGEMPPSAINFFIELLVLPFALDRIHLQNYECPDIRLTTDNAVHLRDRLFGLLFGSEPAALAKSLLFISFLLQVSPEFLEVFCGTFSAQALPVITSTIINKTSSAVTAAAFSILALTLQKNINSFISILPIQQFLDSFSNVLREVPKDIPSFTAFSAGLAFCSTAFSKLCQNSDFQRRNSNRLNPSDYRAFVSTSIIVEHVLESCLSIGSQMPQESLDIACYVAVISSPFLSITLDDLMLDVCVQKLPYLLPYHVPPTLEGVLSLPESAVTPNLPQLLGLFGVSSCAELICDFILQQVNNPHSDYSDMIETLCDAGIIPAICGVISDSGSNCPSSLSLLLAHIVLNFALPNKVLRDNCNEILSTLLSSDTVTETALIISGHFARLSSEFLSPLIQAGVLSYAERALHSEFAVIRARASSLLGNITKHAKLPQENEEVILPILMEELRDENLECRKFAAYAIGNEMYHSESVENYICKDIQAVADLLEASDKKTIEYGGYVIANFIRKNDQFVPDVIKTGALEKIMSLIMERDEVVGVLIQPLSVFCLYDEARKLIKNRGMLQCLQRYSKRGSEIVKTTAQSILHSFEA
ncbi:AGC family protein kinase [Tritrichomonas foetus]|uniref:non-specific serine/threonine protein kinase n=1 Tax=Tritrichomonas foetus TaxID=1144522 RepID=A0A1J4JYH5_9EUKA|nr:AGC family protein kinase [Tritrichomonas foetus]|eukprot:OHT04215.1 AGC family protein kinase [Tritrichomonas foetus]